MSQVNNQWTNIKESMDALLATVHLSSTDIIPEKHDYLDILAKDQEITALKERVEQLEVECAELREDSKEIEYNVEEELINMIDTLRKSIPKHSISKSIFKTIRRLLQDALIDIKETPLHIVYRYIIVEQECEIHGYIYVITDTYIYQLCGYHHGRPLRQNPKCVCFKINAFGIKIDGADKIGFRPINVETSTKINLYSLLSAKEYLMKSEQYIGKATNYRELQLLYKKMERFRDLLLIMLCD
jgi:hypothetical protein